MHHRLSTKVQYIFKIIVTQQKARGGGQLINPQLTHSATSHLPTKNMLIKFNPRTYKQSHTHVVQGWGTVIEPPSALGFCCYLLFQNILPLAQSLWCALHYEVFIMDCSAAWGLWRHWRWRPSWILPKLEIINKRLKLNILEARRVEYDTINILLLYVNILHFFT